MTRLPTLRRQCAAGITLLVAAATLHTGSPANAVPTPPHPGGEIVAVGWSDGGRLDVPDLPPGTSYVDMSAGFSHSAAVRSDGQIVAWGVDEYDKLNPPPLPDGVTYTAVAAEGTSTLAVRSDGQIVPFAEVFAPSMNIPPAPNGTRYLDVGLSNFAAAALRSDGQVVAWGQAGNDLLDVPALPPGTTYVALDVGPLHALALRSDGQVVAWGSNGFGQADVPALPAGVTYTAVSAGSHHSLAVRSDGTAVGFGNNVDGRTDPPALPDGLTYVDVAASQATSLYLRSDGSVVASGSNNHGQANLPAPGATARYTQIEGGSYFNLAIRSDIRPSTTVVELPATATYGRPTRVRVAVDAADLEATGAVSLSIDGTTVATTDVDDAGRATFDFPPTELLPGKHSVAASYSGAHLIAPSSSGPIVLKVAKATSEARAKLIRRTVRPNTRPRLSVTVAAVGVKPTGKVRVRLGSRKVATLRLRPSDGGSTVARLPRVAKPGKYRIRVAYLGSALVKSARSRAITLQVKGR